MYQNDGLPWIYRVETRTVSAVGRSLNRQLIASKNGNPLVMGAGAVSLNEKATSAQLGIAIDGWRR